MFTEIRAGGAGARERQRGWGAKVHSCHYTTYDRRPTSAEQSINRTSVCFMRHWLKASLPEATKSSTRQ